MRKAMPNEKIQMTNPPTPFIKGGQQGDLPFLQACLPVRQGGSGGISFVPLIVGYGFMILSFFSSLSYATDFEEHIERGFQLAYEERYEEARKEFEEVIQEDPENPAGYFFLSGLIGLCMNDFSTLEPEGEFLHSIEEALEHARGKIEKNPLDAWAHFFLGGSYGYRAYHNHQKREFLNAFGDALKAVESLKRAIEIDSTLYDAYMGVGGYHYFIHELWGVVPFVTKDPKEGIREVRIAMEKGRYSRIASKNGLILLLLREKEYTTALKLALELVGEYPLNRTFNWTLAKVFREMGDWERALLTYERLLHLIEEGQPGNLYNFLSCQLEMAEVYYYLKREEVSTELCINILQEIRKANPPSREWGKGFPHPRNLEKETKRLLKKAKMRRN